MIIAAVVRPLEDWCRKTNSDGGPCVGTDVGRIIHIDTESRLPVTCGVAFEVVEQPGFFRCEHTFRVLD